MKPRLAGTFVLCKHCNEPKREHAANKCLFMPTSFAYEPGTHFHTDSSGWVHVFNRTAHFVYHNPYARGWTQASETHDWRNDYCACGFTRGNAHA